MRIEVLRQQREGIPEPASVEQAPELGRQLASVVHSVLAHTGQSPEKSMRLNLNGSESTVRAANALL